MALSRSRFQPQSCEANSRRLNLTLSASHFSVSIMYDHQIFSLGRSPNFLKIVFKFNVSAWRVPSCRSTAPGRENLSSGCIQRESWRRKTAKEGRNPPAIRIRERGRMWAVVGQAATPRVPAALPVRFGIPNLGLWCVSHSQPRKHRAAPPVPSFCSSPTSPSDPRRAASSHLFLNVSLLSDSLLPCSSFPSGDDWASGGATRVLSSPSDLTATSASSRYARPFSFLLLCETEHPKP